MFFLKTTITISRPLKVTVILVTHATSEFAHNILPTWLILAKARHKTTVITAQNATARILRVGSPPWGSFMAVAVFQRWESQGTSPMVEWFILNGWTVREISAPWTLTSVKSRLLKNGRREETNGIKLSKSLRKHFMTSSNAYRFYLGILDSRITSNLWCNGSRSKPRDKS